MPHDEMTELINEFKESTIDFNKDQWRRWIADLTNGRTPYPTPVTYRTDVYGVVKDIITIMNTSKIDSNAFWEALGEILMYNIGSLNNKDKINNSEQIINYILHIIEEEKPIRLKKIVRELVFNKNLLLNNFYIGWLKIWYFCLSIYLGYRAKYIDFDIWSLELEEKLFYEAEKTNDSLFYYITPWYFIYYNRDNYFKYFDKILFNATEADMAHLKKSVSDFLSNEGSNTMIHGSFHLYYWIRNNQDSLILNSNSKILLELKIHILHSLEQSIENTYSKLSFIILCGGFKIIHPKLFCICCPDLSNEKTRRMYVDSLVYYFNSNNRSFLSESKNNASLKSINYWLSNSKSPMFYVDYYNDRAENLIYDVNKENMHIQLRNSVVHLKNIYNYQYYENGLNTVCPNKSLISLMSEVFSVNQIEVKNPKFITT